MEKALKAWLCAVGVAFPKTHDLDELMTLLEEAGQGIPPSVAMLLDFTDFAVAFRYDAFPDLEGEIDRRVLQASALFAGLRSKYPGAHSLVVAGQYS